MRVTEAADPTELGSFAVCVGARNAPAASGAALSPELALNGAKAVRVPSNDTCASSAHAFSGLPTTLGSFTPIRCDPELCRLCRRASDEDDGAREKPRR